LLLALSQADRDQFMKLRDGEITLSQLINRLQSQKTGKHRLCLDDLKPILDPEVFTKPEKDMLAAFRETMVERKLWK
jgi:hypothetical protein